MTERKTGAAGGGAGSGAGKGREAFESAFRTGESAFRAGADAVSGGWDKVFALHGERMESAMQAFRDWDGAADAGRKTMAAWLDGGRIAAEGWTGIAGRAAARAAAAVGEGMAASGKALACKDPVELVDLQTREARRAAEAWLAEGGALAEMAAKTAAAAAAPIAERAGAARAKTAA